MSDWNWCQSVAREILRIVNSKHSLDFDLETLYAQEEAFCALFPDNHHIREKIRQTLQKLRDMGFLGFLGDGRYRVDMNYDGLVAEPRLGGDEWVYIPKFRQRTCIVRLRNTLLAHDLKWRYNHCCQICRETVLLTRERYAEAHHIKPLGSPHSGQDKEGNILVLCPNHHVMFDRGAIDIDRESLTVRHICSAFEPRQLLLAPWHTLDDASLEYYAANIYGRET